MKKRHYKNVPLILTVIAFAIAAIPAIPAIPATAAARAQEVGENVVVVIDAGHGGENRGADSYGEPIEKDMTLTTALAMRDELSQYDGVTVYLTRSGDTDMSLEERADFAESVGADFLFSLHYNASEDHKRFGSEILVSKELPYNAYGVQFGAIELEALTEKGFYSRGIKTRNSDEGDYYGIIRECSARGIPSCIIEHCYVDNEKDRQRCDTTAELQALGVADATSVAKYFGLSSSSYNRDYRDYAATDLYEVNPDGVWFATVNNENGIDELTIEQQSVDIYTGEVTIAVHGYDRDDAIIYYEYSIDGGDSYTELYEWPGAEPLTNDNDSDFTFKITLGTGSTNPITVQAYNQFDQYITSEVLTIDWRRDTQLGGADGYDDEPTGQWINDDGRGSDTAGQANADSGTLISDESGAETETDAASSAGSLFVKNRQLTGLAIFLIVSPFVIGIGLAGWFIYRKTRK